MTLSVAFCDYYVPFVPVVAERMRSVVHAGSSCSCHERAAQERARQRGLSLPAEAGGVLLARRSLMRGEKLEDLSREAANPGAR